MKGLYKRQYYSYSFIYCLLFCTAQVHTQEWADSAFQSRKTKAIENLLKFPKQDTHRIIALVNVYETSTFLKQRIEVKAYVDEAVSLSRKLNFPVGICKSYYWYANYYLAKKEYDTTHLYLDSLIEWAVLFSSPRMNALGHRLRGQLYLRLEDYLRAQEAYQQSLIYFAVHVEDLTLYIYRDLVNIFRYVENIDKALYYAQLALQTAEKLNSKLNFMTACLSYSNVLMSAQNFVKADEMLSKMQGYMPDSTELNLTYSYYLKKGIIAQQKGDHRSAKKLLVQALKYAEQSKHGNSVSEVLSALFQLSLQDGNGPEAKAYAERNLKQALMSQNKLNQYAAWKNLSAFYRIENDYKSAFLALETALVLKDSLMTESAVKHMNLLESSYQHEQKARTIDQLKKHNDVQKIKIQEQYRLNTLLVVTLICLLLIVILAYKYFTNQRKLQLQYISELERNKHIQTIDAILQGQENERRRMAQELHDSLGGMLSGIKLSMMNMKDHLMISPENHYKFENAMHLMDKSIQELRHVAHNLMPAALVKLGLREALADYTQTVETSGTIPVKLQCLGVDRALNATAEIYIYRIVQELVTNAMKHAQAHRVLVQLVFSETDVEITVEDDGIGFERTMEPISSMGLMNIQYRVEYLKGKLNIQSTKEKGTSIYISLPV
ncbi:MAG: hypothetical protein IPM92_12360 [Saprospiraceae bacterium]|nr:hypothetical protein [Saprospiraceae bacterium]